MQLGKFFISGAVLILGSGCTSITDISDESPYQEMIGQCYVLQQDMHIQETCWEIGDLALSTGESTYCFHEILGEVPKGSEVTIIQVKERFSYVMGSCAQLILSIPGIEIPNREISPPVCVYARDRDWNEDMNWNRGKEIHFKEKFVKPCE